MKVVVAVRWKEWLITPLALVMMINLLLAASSFMKDVVFAKVFGTSTYADALTLAFFIPDTIGNNILAFAIGVACVPVFAKLFVLKKWRSLALLIRNLSVIVTASSLLICVGLIIGQKPLLHWIGAGMDANTQELSQMLMMILLPMIVMFPLVAIGGAVLQTLDRFVLPALGPVVFNGVWLLAMVWLMHGKVPLQKGVYVVAISIVAGVFGMLLLISYPLFAAKGRTFWHLVWKQKWKKEWFNRDIWVIFFPFLLTLLSSQLIYFVERSFASTLEPGTLAGLNYAFRLSQFPIWVFVSAISVVILPAMAKEITAKNWADLKAMLIKAYGFVLLITIPVSLVFFFAREPIISLLFQRGAFDAKSVAITADILFGYSLSIAWQGVATLSVRYFLAVGEMRVPSIIYISSSVLTIGLNVLLVPILGAKGIGIAAACGAVVTSVFLIFFCIQSVSRRANRHINLRG